MNVKLITEVIESVYALTMHGICICEKTIDRQEVELMQTNHASSTTFIRHMITPNKE